MPPQVPLVDISAFTADSPLATRQKAARDLAQKCGVNGCLAITGHGVDPEAVQDAFDLMKSFYKLPEEVKMLAPHPEASSPHRGYSPPGREKAYTKEEHTKSDAQKQAALAATANLKEVYDIGDDMNEQEGNIWLPENALPGFRERSMKIYQWFKQVRSAILEALMLGMNLTEEECEEVRALHAHVYDQLRYLHYLPASRKDLSNADNERLPAHTDWCSFTISFQDRTGGLEFKDRGTGTFMPATPKNNTLYLNVGDMLMRLSNDIYPACSHRVVVPAPLPNSEKDDCEIAPERYSLVYFVPPHPDGILKPQPSCIASGEKSSYEPLVYSGYKAEKAKWSYSQQQFESVH